MKIIFFLTEQELCYYLIVKIIIKKGNLEIKELLMCRGGRWWEGKKVGREKSQQKLSQNSKYYEFNFNSFTLMFCNHTHSLLQKLSLQTGKKWITSHTSWKGKEPSWTSESYCSLPLSNTSGKCTEVKKWKMVILAQVNNYKACEYSELNSGVFTYTEVYFRLWLINQLIIFGNI